jgi:hypothetical protein
MKGDFSRDTFDPARQFTRVLMQQGRVQLDADWNEQASILLRYLQALAEDLIGPFGGPADIMSGPNVVQKKYGFEIGALKSGATLTDLKIGEGRYYVDGVLCENESADASYFGQSNYPRDKQKNPLPTVLPFLVYLDIWERHITSLEDDHIREVALGGPDTSSRAQLVWQVKIWPSSEADRPMTPSAWNCGDVRVDWDKWKELLQPDHRGQLVAGTRSADVDPSKPCITPPEARYRGAENQLYRVEVHRPGAAWNGDAGTKSSAATFKWSRDNGSVVFPIVTLSGKQATLADLGRDGRLTLEPDDWVEIVDDDQALSGQPGPLAQVQQVDSARRTVIFKDNPIPAQGSQSPTYDANSSKHPLLRRWDHQAGNPTEGGLELSEGAALIKEDNSYWLLIEDGMQIQFKPSDAAQNWYRTGDYWLIPARTATGDVEWPREPNPTYNPLDPNSPKTRAAARPPRGVYHHYAPLAMVNTAGDADDCRCSFERQACPPPPAA